MNSSEAEVQCSGVSVWQGGEGRVGPVVVRTVTYRCGCSVTLSEVIGPKECGLTCDEHLEPVKKVVTVEEWL